MHGERFGYWNEHHNSASPTMRTLFLLLYGTGMRIGEALSLTLQDVNLENRVLMGCVIPSVRG